jgi:hypothetical protein
MEYVRKELKLEDNPVQLWCDNKGVVQWLRDESIHGRFEQNRCRRIREYPVKHVPGEENPADIASRGEDPQTLLANKFWFEGPEWLKLHESQWSPCKCEYNPSIAQEPEEDRGRPIFFSGGFKRPGFSKKKN